MLNGIVRQLEATSEGDIPSERLGELVMEGLQAIDDVAYVRFRLGFTKDFARGRAISRNCSGGLGRRQEGLGPQRARARAAARCVGSARRLRRKRSAREPGMSPRLARNWRKRMKPISCVPRFHAGASGHLRRHMAQPPPSAPSSSITPPGGAGHQWARGITPGGRAPACRAGRHRHGRVGSARRPPST